MIALAAVILGLVLGLVSGGSVRRLESAHIRFEWAALMLFVIQAVARGRVSGAGASTLGMAIWVGSGVVLLAILAPDWRHAGVWLIGLGLGLNLIVVLLNGGMPVVVPSDVTVGSAAQSIAGAAGFYQLAGPGTHAKLLGDVIRLGAAGSRILVSPGDILLLIGLTAFIVDAMLPARLGRRSAVD